MTCDRLLALLMGPRRPLTTSTPQGCPRITPCHRAAGSERQKHMGLPTISFSFSFTCLIGP